MKNARKWIQMSAVVFALAAFALAVYLLNSHFSSAPDSIRISAVSEGWKKISSQDDGFSISLFRKKGLKALLIYAGNTPDSRTEIEPITGQILAAGYNLMVSSQPPDMDQVASEKRQDEFFQLALDRPGFTNRIFLIHGKRLPSALRFLREKEYQAIIVYHPGEAPPDNGELVHALASLQKNSILWIGSGIQPEQSRSDYLAAQIRAPVHRIRIADLFAPQTELSHESNENFFNFLMLNRMELQWEGARNVFTAGCSIYPDGSGKIGLTRYQVSARRDVAFCPLFLRSPGGNLHRVRQVTENGCEYAGGQLFWKLFCRY